MTKQRSSSSKKKTYDYDLLVVGCGPAGQRAAVQASKVGKRVCIVDKLEVEGGVCVNLGTIPSKSFKEAVVFLSGYRQRNIYGAGYRVKADIEMPDLTFRCHRIMQTEIEVIRHQLTRNKIKVMTGIASLLDPHTVEIDSVLHGKSQKTAEIILLAVGAEPRRPKNIKFDGKNIFDSDDILSMETVPRTMTVVGGGVIGTEYASMFAALGTHVTIVDARKRLMSFVDEEIIECLQYQMRSMGVTLRLGEEVAACEAKEDGQVVTELKSGKVIVSERVLYSAGRVSATSNLGLKKVGVETDDYGRIKVNKKYQTARKSIYAAGDVIGFPRFGFYFSSTRKACFL